MNLGKKLLLKLEDYRNIKNLFEVELHKKYKILSQKLVFLII